MVDHRRLVRIAGRRVVAGSPVCRIEFAGECVESR